MDATQQFDSAERIAHEIESSLRSNDGARRRRRVTRRRPVDQGPSVAADPLEPRPPWK